MWVMLCVITVASENDAKTTAVISGTIMTQKSIGDFVLGTVLASLWLSVLYSFSH